MLQEKKGDDSVAVVTFFTPLQQKEIRQPSEEGNNNNVAIAFFATL